MEWAGDRVEQIVHLAYLPWLVYGEVGKEKISFRHPADRPIRATAEKCAIKSISGIFMLRWHMDSIKTKVGQGGRIVLPVEFRKAMGIKPGDEVILAFKDGEVRVFTRQMAIKRAQGMLKHIAPGRSLADELIQERRAEAARE